MITTLFGMDVPAEARRAMVRTMVAPANPGKATEREYINTDNATEAW